MGSGLGAHAEASGNPAAEASAASASRRLSRNVTSRSIAQVFPSTGSGHAGLAVEKLASRPVLQSQPLRVAGILRPVPEVNAARRIQLVTVDQPHAPQGQRAAADPRD